MGCYVNPPGQSQTSWLRANGREISASEAKITESELPVCCVDNGMFTASAVGYEQGEIDVFARPDGRPKTWYMVPREKLYEVSDLKSWER